jgi:indole-3-glycerol phosphate synthase/phosphoribosylanthranilate isomerase
VFRDPAERDILTAVDRLDLDAVQLHGRETPEFTSTLRSRMPQRTELWGLCGVGAAASPGRPGIDRSVFDTVVAGRSGGTGRSFDWKLVQGRKDLPSAFLAGGIGPHNAAEAARVGAYGLDVGSAVERYPGAKDADKVAALFTVLRPGSRAQP